MDLKRGSRARPGEWIVERGIFAVSFSAILMVLLIFVFVGREALPIFLGRMNTSLVGKIIPPGEMENLSTQELQTYLDLSPEQFRSTDRGTLKALMELKVEAAKEVPNDKDASVNTISWKYLLFPHQWRDYPRPVYIWQPVSPIPKYNIVPLILGSLKVTVVALLFSVPLALAAAIFVSQLVMPRWREILKPGIELVAGIPSVVLGFFALIVMATVLQRIFGYGSRLNAFVAGIALGFAVIPVVFSIAEDALTSVPRTYTQAALALGASKWQAASQIVFPAALPGVFAAILLGFGRAIGETMVVLMASGNASIVSWSFFDSTRTITATIAAEVLEAPIHGSHYRVLFMIASLLFVVTFVSNLVGELVVHRLKNRLEGRA